MTTDPERKTDGVRWWKSTVDGLSLRCRLGLHSPVCAARDEWIVRLKADRDALEACWEKRIAEIQSMKQQ